MSNLVQKTHLILVDVGENSNKHWRGELFEDGTVITYWSRVGLAEQSTVFPPSRGGARFLEKKIAEKKKKGYSELKVVQSGGEKTISPVGDLAHIAKKQIRRTNEPILDALIDRLVKENIHRITSATQITYNTASGLFQTPLGVVTLDAISEARQIIVKLEPLILRREFNSGSFNSLINSYFRLIPQDIGMKRFDGGSFFSGDDAIQRQIDIIDSLESSYAAMSTAKPDESGKVEVEEKVFDLELSVASKSEFDRIKALFNKTRQGIHYAVTNLQPANVYKIALGENESKFNKRGLGNVWELWHGTKTCNLISILKSGIQIKPPSTAPVAGAMFGRNGAYFSDQSTKSLNYTTNYWSSGASGGNFMFLADVAMGNYYVPRSSTGSPPPAGYDSYFAQPGVSNIANNEMIVFDNSQIKLKYLIEFR
jgi:poly [ADP-ribose] polymerase